jgi:hypothetical protein
MFCCRRSRHQHGSVPCSAAPRYTHPVNDPARAHGVGIRRARDRRILRRPVAADWHAGYYGGAGSGCPPATCGCRLHTGYNGSAGSGCPPATCGNAADTAGSIALGSPPATPTPRSLARVRSNNDMSKRSHAHPAAARARPNPLPDLKRHGDAELATLFEGWNAFDVARMTIARAPADQSVTTLCLAERPDGSRSNSFEVVRSCGVAKKGDDPLATGSADRIARGDDRPMKPRIAPRAHLRAHLRIQRIQSPRRRHRMAVSART